MYKRANFLNNVTPGRARRKTKSVVEDENKKKFNMKMGKMLNL